MHHQRRKSGNASTSDLRKLTTTSSERSKRPGMTRRQTPSSQSSSSTYTRSSRAHRDKDDAWFDGAESFPQFCMTCEKQFLPSDDMLLYCSDSCRRVDQDSSSSQAATVRGYTTAAYSHSNLIYSADQPERDIVPRASPSRPTSMHFSQSPPASPDSLFAPQPPSAISALRALTVRRPPSPPSPTFSSTLWPSASLSNSSYSSYTRPTNTNTNTNTITPSTSRDFSTASAQMHSYETDERPLPPRTSGVFSRPKSIELVTPLLPQ